MKPTYNRKATKDLRNLKCESVESFLARGGVIETGEVRARNAELELKAKNAKKTEYQNGNDMYDADAYKQLQLRGMA